jgi:hypothetical protein
LSGTSGDDAHMKNEVDGQVDNEAEEEGLDEMI